MVARLYACTHPPLHRFICTAEGIAVSLHFPVYGGKSNAFGLQVVNDSMQGTTSEWQEKGGVVLMGTRP